MKKILLAAVLLAAISMTSCSNGEAQPVTTAPASSETTEQTTKLTLPKIKINDETVNKSDKPSATEPKATEQETTSQPKTKKKKKKKQQPTTAAPTQGQTRAGTHIEVTEAPVGSFSEEDLEFILDGAFIYLDDEIEDVLALAGDDNSVSELGDDAYLYEYDDYSFTTYTKKEKEKVDSITVLTDAIETQKGAKVGMYATKLKSVYGDATKKSDTLYTYVSGKKSLEFNVEDNIVTSYTYRLKH